MNTFQKWAAAGFLVVLRADQGNILQRVMKMREYFDEYTKSVDFPLEILLFLDGEECELFLLSRFI